MSPKFVKRILLSALSWTAIIVIPIHLWRPASVDFIKTISIFVLCLIGASAWNLLFPPASLEELAEVVHELAKEAEEKNRPS
jgi:hypothetical protein